MWRDDLSGKQAAGRFFLYTATYLVHHEDRPYTLGDGLAEHSLGLHAHTLHAVHHHKRTIGYTKGGRHLDRDRECERNEKGRKINVS